MGADWKGGSIVLVTVQNLILPVAYMQEFPLQQICQYRLTNFIEDKILIGELDGESA